jgi:hypothetical protein
MRRLLPLLALAALLAGCGGDSQPSKSAYVDGFRNAERQSLNAVNRFLIALGDTQLPQQAWLDQIHAGRRATGDFVDKLRALDPPKDVAKLHRQFVASERASLDGLDHLIAKLDAGKLSRAEFERRARQVLAFSGAEQTAVAKQMKAKGYDIFIRR